MTSRAIATTSTSSDLQDGHAAGPSSPFLYSTFGALLFKHSCSIYAPMAQSSTSLVSPYVYVVSGFGMQLFSLPPTLSWAEAVHVVLLPFLPAVFCVLCACATEVKSMSLMH